MQEPSRADPCLCWAGPQAWAARTPWLQGEPSQPSETHTLQPAPPALLILKHRWKFPCEHPFYLTAKIMDRVVFLQGNPAAEKHGVTFLWLGSAQRVALGLFKGLFGAAQSRVSSIKRDPRLSIRISLYMVSFNK